MKPQKYDRKKMVHHTNYPHKWHPVCQVLSSPEVQEDAGLRDFQEDVKMMVLRWSNQPILE